MGDNKSNLSRLAPVMLAFFTMGFVDMVGTATNYVKADFALSDTMANFLPSMVFLWFFFLSIPIGLMMNRIGKRKTVVMSLVVTALALVLPLFSYTYPVLLVSFCLLGIGTHLQLLKLGFKGLGIIIIRSKRGGRIKEQYSRHLIHFRV